MKLYPCPCCGHLVFTDGPGSDDICPICFWEDDIVQLAFPNLVGGANKTSLIESQQNFIKYGVCERRFIKNVKESRTNDKKDKDWRPININEDNFFDCNKKEDNEKWDRIKNSQGINLYYWTEEYIYK